MMNNNDFNNRTNINWYPGHMAKAKRLIKENLYKSYLEPNNLEARNNMQLAAYKAGVAFTNAYVGYVHAIAHALGGQYNIPHGLANALILPLIMKEYGKKAYKQLAKIYDYIDLDNKDISKKEKSEKIIDWIISHDNIRNPLLHKHN